MLAHFLRMLLQMVLFFLLLGVVLAVAAPTTGTAEKVVLVAIGLALAGVAYFVRRLEHRDTAHG